MLSFFVWALILGCFIFASSPRLSARLEAAIWTPRRKQAVSSGALTVGSWLLLLAMGALALWVVSFVGRLVL